MVDYCAQDIMFQRFLNCLEAIDLMFQKSYMQGKNNKERQYWVSGKHHQPGLKMEVAVGPNRRARYASKLYPGSFHNITIFKEGIDKHLSRLVKEDGDIYKQDNMTVDAIEENNQWGALANKGYTGACWYGWFIIPKKKRPGKKLSLVDKN